MYNKELQRTAFIINIYFIYTGPCVAVSVALQFPERNHIITYEGMNSAFTVLMWFFFLCLLLLNWKIFGMVSAT